MCPILIVNLKYPLLDNFDKRPTRDSSYLPEVKGTGFGLQCNLFENYLAVGKNTSNYEGEICADQEATKQLMALYLLLGRVVFCFYSQAVISALSRNRLPAPNPGRSRLCDWTVLDMAVM
ncbi:hypothetical protein CEXT_494621 [Caerostris extrusa]|uniref:Uncharacterized protein n=1 Tax=Caerostris extrusa TaxID=172846 RepID=A0AAV4WYI6_CAEEX|nr:hypothetical protein CEXT_494621 [Caerostris extrusa]